jgi:hypothetical protein
MASCGRRFSHLTDTRSPDISKELSGGLKAEVATQPKGLRRGLKREEKGKR